MVKTSSNLNKIEIFDFQDETLAILFECILTLELHNFSHVPNISATLEADSLLIGKYFSSSDKGNEFVEHLCWKLKLLMHYSQ